MIAAVYLDTHTSMYMSCIDNEPSWPMKGLNRSQLIATLLSTTHWQWNKSCANLRIVWTISKHFRPGAWTPFSAIRRLWLYNLRAYAITSWETDKRELEPRHNTPHNIRDSRQIPLTLLRQKKPATDRTSRRHRATSTTDESHTTIKIVTVHQDGILA